MDTNAAQFARMGFPWTDAPAEGPTLPTRASRKIRRAAPSMAKAKPEFREEGYVKRALTAEEERRAARRAFLAQHRRTMREMSIRPVHPQSSTPLVQPREVLDPAALERIANRGRLEAEYQAEQLRLEAERRAAVAARRAAEAAEDFAEGMALLEAALKGAFAD